MKQYFVVIWITIKQLLTYRLSFLLWRFRTVLNLLFVYFLWTNIITYKSNFSGYDFKLIITYILLINILTSIVIGTRTTDVVNDILTGDISNYLLRPFSYFRYLISREIGDKSLNFFFSVIEVILLIIIFKPVVFIQHDLISFFLFLISLTIGIILSFLISLCLSFMAFWSNDTWAPRFIYFILISLVAGTMFPLDILPIAIYRLILLTPFPYLVFLPAAIFVHGYKFEYIYLLIIGGIWSLVFLWLIKKIWNIGIKNYSAYGR